MDNFVSCATIPQEENYFGDEFFMLYTYKVERCMISQPHSWKNCPFVHHQEPIKRRHPTQHMAHLCPLVKKGQTCLDDSCCCAHNAFELWLHPERYKTIMCRKGAACGRGICFFAHSEAELRVPTKAKAMDLSNPATAAGAVGAALKFKAVAQALPSAAMSAALVSARRAPVSLQVSAAQNQQLLGVPAMSHGVPAMLQGVPAMSQGVPAMSQGAPSMSLGAPASTVPMSVHAAALPGVSTVPEHVNLSGVGHGIAGCNPMPVHLDLGYMNGSNTISGSYTIMNGPNSIMNGCNSIINGCNTIMNGSNTINGSNTSLQHLQPMSWAGSASTASAAGTNSISSSSYSQCSSGSSSRRMSFAAFNSIGSTSHNHCSSGSSSGTRLDLQAGDYLLLGSNTCTARNAGSSSSTPNGIAAIAPVALGRQHKKQMKFPAAIHADLSGPVWGGLAVPPQQQQQPLLLHLAQAAAAVRAEVEKGVGVDADWEAAVQSAADRVAALLFTGPFGRVCAGGDTYPSCHLPAVHDTARKSRSFDLPIADISVAVTHQQLVRLGSA